MLTILSIIICVVSAVSFLIFKADIVYMIIATVLATVSLVLSLLKKKKLMPILSALLALASCAVLYLASYQNTSNPFSAYMKQYHKAENAVDADPDKTIQILDEIREQYNYYYEYAPCLYGQAYFNKNDYEQCYQQLMDSNRKNIFYYDALGKLYVAASKTKQVYSFLNKNDNYKVLIQDLYLDAAKRIPGWSFGKEVCGMYAYENDKNLNVANYYLLGSLGLNEKDGNCWYYLGQVYYDLKNYDGAKGCFEVARKYEHTPEIEECLNLYFDLLKGDNK